MQKRPIVPQYNPQHLLRQLYSWPLTQQLAVQLALPRAKRLLSLPIATPIYRPLATKGLTFYTARKTTL